MPTINRVSLFKANIARLFLLANRALHAIFHFTVVSRYNRPLRNPSCVTIVSRDLFAEISIRGTANHFEISTPSESYFNITVPTVGARCAIIEDGARVPY